MKTKHISPKRKAYIALMRTLMAIAAILTGALVLFLIVYVLAKGIPTSLGSCSPPLPATCPPRSASCRTS